MSAVGVQAAGAAAAAERTVITQRDQLPRRTVTLPMLPSELLAVPLADLQAIAAPVEKNLLADLERYDIQDSATQRDYYTALAALAQLRGDWAAVPHWTAKGRALQAKVGGKLTSGLVTDLLSQQRSEGRDAAWVQAEVQRRFGTLPWGEVQDAVRAFKGSIETFNPELIKGAFQSQDDALAKNGQMTIPEGLLTAIVNTRMRMELMSANKQAVLAGLQAVIDAQGRAVTKPDIWTPRTFAIPADAKAQPVVVGIWDYGVDLSLFNASAARGMAFDHEAQPSPHLLPKLGVRWEAMQVVLKGAMDQSAALDTPESRAFRDRLSGLKADQVRALFLNVGAASIYAHGTHVAGIAVEGNPFAEVYAARSTWVFLSERIKPNEARTQATAASYTAMVQGFKQAGVKVVNMSWRYGPSAYEAAMAYHNMGASPEARKQEAQRLFKIERDALHQAIAGAPEIFFVAGSGNEDNSADFEEYIPAGFSLPNLITVGAVDKAGTETSFSTFGKTVAVHANGFEVDAPVPGGVRMKLSGTSMASPQVANLAAKLLALKPSLTPVELKAAILDGAERQAGADGKAGRVNLINPRKSAALVGLTLAP